jgi:hypothetical protein
MTVDGRISVRMDIIEYDREGEAKHTYWSTHCRHNDHRACAADRIVGTHPVMGSYTSVEREPAQCKHCAARCVCPCHIGDAS